MIKKKQQQQESSILKRRVEQASPGEVVTVSSFVGECKSILELYDIVTLAEVHGVELRSEREVWFDPNLEQRLGKMMCLLCDLQREFVVNNSNRGLAQAKSEGKKLGRPSGMRPETAEKVRLAVKLAQNGEVAISSICRGIGISYNVFRRYREVFEQELLEKRGSTTARRGRPPRGVQ